MKELGTPGNNMSKEFRTPERYNPDYQLDAIDTPERNSFEGLRSSK